VWVVFEWCVEVVVVGFRLGVSNESIAEKATKNHCRLLVKDCLLTLPSEIAIDARLMTWVCGVGVAGPGDLPQWQFWV